MPSSSAGPLRVALLGYGLAGRWFHRPLVGAARDLRLTHVVTSDATRAGQAAGDAPGCVVVPDAAALWARAGEFDAVVVATGNTSHTSLALAALELGKPVVVDKPLGLTAAQARGPVDAAARLGVPFTVFSNRRWDSDTLTLAALLRDGALGTVSRFESRFQRFRPEVAVRWREAPAAQGGGILLDLGPHLVDQALHLFGPVLDVYAEVDVRRPGAETDDDCFLALRHASGTRTSLWCSLAAPAGGPRVSVEGSTGGYVKRELDGQEAALRAGWNPASGPWGREPAGLLTRGEVSHEVESLPGDWVAFYDAFAAAVRGHGPVPVEPRDAVSVLEVLDAARTSSAEHRVVPFVGG